MLHPSDLIPARVRLVRRSVSGRSSLQLAVVLALIGGAAVLLGAAATAFPGYVAFEPAIEALRAAGDRVYDVLTNPASFLRAIGARDLIVGEMP